MTRQYLWTLCVGLLALVLNSSARGVIETYEFDSDLQRHRYQDFIEELRCPKCQNQNIADSNAPIAQDLRKLLYQQLEAGADDDEILDHMVARYGEFVRYRPRFSGATAVLWLAPVLLLLVGIGAAFATLRARRERPLESSPLSAEDEQRLQNLLDKPENHS